MSLLHLAQRTFWVYSRTDSWQEKVICNSLNAFTYNFENSLTPFFCLLKLNILKIRFNLRDKQCRPYRTEYGDRYSSVGITTVCWLDSEVRFPIEGIIFFQTVQTYFGTHNAPIIISEDKVTVTWS